MQVTLVDGQPKVALSQKEKRTLRDAEALCSMLSTKSDAAQIAADQLEQLRYELDPPPQAPTTPPNASEPQADKDTK